jgi:hypothetical protein
VKEQLEQKEIDYARGKVAGHSVWDDEGNAIVEAGDTITDDAINRAKESGSLHYLMLSAAASVIGRSGEAETSRRLQEFRDLTEGHEEDFVRGGTAMREVSDFQGNVLV